MIDWKFIVSKRLNRKYLYGLAWNWESMLEASGTEDFNEPIILNKGSLFIDGGASYGFWSIRASPFYEQVIAVEPDKKTFRILCSNIEMNHLNNVFPINVALGAHNGQVGFHADGTGESSLLSSHMGKKATTEKVMVPMTTIDSLDVSPSLIKLDVEAAELEALEGAKRTINIYRPKLIVEVHEPVKPEQVKDLLSQYNWTTRWRYLNKALYPFEKQPHLEGLYRAS